jgi:DinB superfamily
VRRLSPELGASHLYKIPKKLNVHPRLQSYFTQLENQRKSVTKLINSVSEERFTRIPGNDKWSAHQVVAHLLTAEKLSLQYMTKKMNGVASAGDTGILEELKMVAIILSQRLPFRYTAPKSVVEATPHYPGRAALINEWATTRHHLGLFLNQFTDELLKRKIYKHVVAGRLNIVHALIFFREHIIHHLPQLNRLLR